MTRPVAEYTRANGCSIAGGFVYRGQAIPSLAGYFLYGDFCSGNVWALNSAEAAAGTPTTPVLLWSGGPGPIAFGQDAAGELDLLTIEAEIFKIVP